MVVSAGENVYPIEVEQVLLAHPQVEDAAVVGVSDQLFGQRLKAFVLLKRDADIGRAELSAWLRRQLARFQMPRDLVFVDNLPYTPVDKLDRQALK